LSNNNLLCLLLHFFKNRLNEIRHILILPCGFLIIPCGSVR
jgi:hypothetical protein